MEVEQIYCPGCNHGIRLTRTAAHRDGQASLPAGAEVVCLDFGEGCADRRCPVTGRPGIVMGVRLARSHLKDEPWRTVTARCDGCGEVADLEILDDTYALCPRCETTNRWVLIRVSPEARIAVTGR